MSAKCALKKTYLAVIGGITPYSSALYFIEQILTENLKILFQGGKPGKVR